MLIASFTTFLLIIEGVKSGYYVQDSHHPTQSTCNLATPKIYFSSNLGPYVTLPVGLNTAQFEKHVTVGYIQRMTSFLYIGCITRQSAVFVSIPTGRLRDPGYCYSACNRTTYVGVSPSECYCFTQRFLANTRQQYCTMQCDHQAGTLCGGKHFSRVYISIYKHVADTVAIRGSELEASCLSYNTQYKIYTWKRCNTSLRGICESSTGPLDTYLHWWRYATECLRKKLSPANPPVKVNIHGHHWNNGHHVMRHDYWTGVIRSWVIEEVSDMASIIRYDRVGYIKNGWAYHTLLFDRMAENMLCFKVDTTSIPWVHTTSSSSVTVQRTTSTRKSTVQKSFSTTVPVTSSSTKVLPSQSPYPTSQYPSITRSTGRKTLAQTTQTFGGISGAESNTRDKDTGARTYMIAVYVASPIIVVIAVIGSICFLRRIRRKRGDATGTKDITRNPRTKIAVNNISYDGDTMPSDPPAMLDHNYCILDAPSEYYNITSTESQENDYYETATTSHAKGNTTGNIYNILETVSDDTYDHTDATNIHVDDTYNHALPDTCYVYDTADKKHDLGAPLNKFDTTYDHTSPRDLNNEYSTSSHWKEQKEHELNAQQYSNMESVYSEARN